MPERRKIPVIDLFAGPGGLAEGFSSFINNGERLFVIRLSIEKDIDAHITLQLRSFYRQFPGPIYYQNQNNRFSMNLEFYNNGEIVLKLI